MSMILPVKELATFIKAAKGWIGNRTEAKRAFEIRFANEGGNLHLSCGADSAFMEAIIDADATSITAPFFLDMVYLSQYDFKTDKLVMLPPDTSAPVKGGLPRQVQFKAKGANFRIPLRNGDVWARNNQNFSRFDINPSISFSEDLLNKVYPLLKLPDSFNMGNPPMVKLERNGVAPSISAYYFDGYGAFWHSFVSEEFTFENNFQSAFIQYDFLSPYKKIEDFKILTLHYGEAQTVASLEFDPDNTAFKTFRWIEPNYNKACPNVPQILSQKRSGVDNCLIFGAEEFLDNVKRSVSFYSKDQQRKEPVIFNMIGDQYALKGTLENSEMIVDGVAKQGLSKGAGEISVQFQSGCLVDYLEGFLCKGDINVEILEKTTVMYEEVATEGFDQNLLYWMPTQKVRNVVKRDHGQT